MEVKAPHVNEVYCAAVSFYSRFHVKSSMRKHCVHLVSFLSFYVPQSSTLCEILDPHFLRLSPSPRWRCLQTLGPRGRLGSLWILEACMPKPGALNAKPPICKTYQASASVCFYQASASAFFLSRLSFFTLRCLSY